MRSPALAAAALVSALATPGAAQAPVDSGVPGSELTIYLMTMGQGDLVWERYGHNAIGIRDRRAGTDIVYNWGIFSFDQPGFIGRFLRGEMMYWMAGQDFAQTLASYRYFNRTVEVQELNLPPPQRLVLRDFIHWNAREENKYYRYDYFLDNCSTRVRDALDRVLGGALRQATDTVRTGATYRWHSLRLMAEDPLYSIGIDIGLGRPTDRPITAWEEMFIPMKVRDRVRDLRVPDETGRLIPLVTSEAVVFQAARVAERDRPPTRWPFLGLAGLVLGGIVWRVGARRERAGLRMVVITLVAVSLGVPGLALVFLRFFTQHTAAWGNLNLFVYNPLWLLLPLALAFTRGGRLTVALASILGALAAIGLFVPFVPRLGQGSIAVILLAAPAALAAAWQVREHARAVAA